MHYTKGPGAGDVCYKVGWTVEDGYILIFSFCLLHMLSNQTIATKPGSINVGSSLYSKCHEYMLRALQNFPTQTITASMHFTRSAFDVHIFFYFSHIQPDAHIT